MRRGSSFGGCREFLLSARVEGGADEWDAGTLCSSLIRTRCWWMRWEEISVCQCGCTAQICESFRVEEREEEAEERTQRCLARLGRLHFGVPPHVAYRSWPEQERHGKRLVPRRRDVGGRSFEGSESADGAVDAGSRPSLTRISSTTSGTFRREERASSISRFRTSLLPFVPPLFVDYAQELTLVFVAEGVSYDRCL